MEFLDEDTRPRFLFQSRPQSSSSAQNNAPQNSSKSVLFVSLPLACLFLCLSVLSVQTEPLKSLLIWLSLSLFIGPFAPASITGGDIRVGQGPIVPDTVDSDLQPEHEPKKKHAQKRLKAETNNDSRESGVSFREFGNGYSQLERKDEIAGGVSSLDGKKGDEVIENGGEEEWTEEDVEILKKQMVKNPVGKPGRWEAIAGALKRRHKVETVIKKSKELGEKKLDDSNSYVRFLKNRKPLDMRINGGNEEGIIDSQESKQDKDGEDVGMGWSSGEDIALLNAMKAFPKEVAMRWEKIAAAVPGKSKAACMKRATELKKEFRRSKASKEG